MFLNDFFLKGGGGGGGLGPPMDPPLLLCWEVFKFHGESILKPQIYVMMWCPCNAGKKEKCGLSKDFEEKQLKQEWFWHCITTYNHCINHLHQMVSSSMCRRKSHTSVTWALSYFLPHPHGSTQILHIHVKGSVTQRRNSIFCQNKFLISKCSEKVGFLGNTKT